MTEYIQLDEADVLASWETTSTFKEQYGDGDFHQFFYRCWRSGSGLPTRLSKALFDFRRGGQGVMLIKGLRLPFPLPPTPIQRGSTWVSATLQARKLMCILLSQLGHIYNFSAKKDFDYIDDVFPIYSDRNAQLGTNRSFLEWHVEDGFHPAKADLVALYCMRGDPNAQTYLCEARDLDLQPQFREELTKPNFLIRVDPTFNLGGKPVPEYRCAVLTPGNDPEVVYDPAYMEGVTPEAQAALGHVRECVDRAHQAITLEEGDLLVFDNRRVMHARSAYTPAYDGSDRWLLRSLLLESYWKARECLQELA
jgi:L-asparagine oxygenase